MKIVKFKAGLGNHLFQYAFMRALELKYNVKDVKADFTWIANWYSNKSKDFVEIQSIEKMNVKIEKVSNNDINKVCYLKNNKHPRSFYYKALVLIENLINKKHFFEWDRDYRDPNSLLKYNFFDGYWQSWRYLSGIEDVLRSELTLKEALSEKTENTVNEIIQKNAVFIGIRRGDYVTNSRARTHYGTFDMEYYSSAIEYIKERVDQPIFYIFSNDIQWVKENMEFDCNIVFRDEENQTSDIEELFIMAACKHAVIVNSTFYWWGAWLIDNPNKIIIAPQNWFADSKPIDIIPDSWVKM